MNSETCPREIYEDIGIFGGDTVEEGDYRAVRVGGFLWMPSVARSYLLAARSLIDENEALGHLVLPISYLQRHAFEVAMKDIIETARDVARSETWLEALKADPAAPRPDKPASIAERSKRDKAWGHNLPQIMDALEADLRAIKFDPPPSELRKMAIRLWKIESQQPDRWRYDRVKPKGNPPEPSFRTEQGIPVEQTQLDLEWLFRRHIWCPTWEHATAKDAPLLGRLGLEDQGLQQTLLHRLSMAGRDPLKEI